MRVYADGVRLLKTLPSQASDIFAGQDFVMLARYDHDGPTRLRFEGTTANGPVVWSSRVVFPASSRENSFIARLWATQRVGYLSAEKRRNGGSTEVDDEIRQLGERYGIPTEFSSYLVLEPGMDPRRRLGAAMNAPGMQLGQVVVTGVATAAKSSNDVRFEAARASAAQRSAITLSAADAASAVIDAGGAARRSGNRLFVLRDSVWTDTGLKDSTTRLKIRPYSTAYFKVLELLPELREPFALGEKVIVTGRSIAIEITPKGEESLSNADFRSLQAKW